MCQSIYFGVITFNVTVMTMTVKTNVPKVQFPNIYDIQTAVIGTAHECPVTQIHAIATLLFTESLLESDVT